MVDGDGAVTTVLTLYRRPYVLDEQIQAVRDQIGGAGEIWLWVNAHPDNASVALDRLGVDRICRNDVNWKFYGRFALALLAETSRVAIFDDDAIPGTEWYQNCEETMAGRAAILGTGGVRFPDGTYDHETNKYGWIRPSDDAVEVDFVGQAWYLRTADLAHLWRERPATWSNGEDMHLGYAAQRFGALPSIVPPHPAGRPERSGSRSGEIYDGDAAATSLNDPEFYAGRRLCFDEYRRRGWELGVDRGWASPRSRNLPSS